MTETDRIKELEKRLAELEHRVETLGRVPLQTEPAATPASAVATSTDDKAILASLAVRSYKDDELAAHLGVDPDALRSRLMMFEGQAWIRRNEDGLVELTTPGRFKALGG